MKSKRMNSSGLALLFAAGLAGAVVAGDGGKLLIFNEDNDHYFKLSSAKMNESDLRQYVDGLAAGGKVTHFFMCPSGQRTSYASEAWEPIWDGLNEPDHTGRTNHIWAVNAKKLHDAGIDPYQVWIDQCRKHGISPWLTIRMNDVHFVHIKNYFRNTNFFKQNRQFWVVPEGKRPDWSHFCLDFAHKEVREYTFKLIREQLERYDIDGYEMDFMRHVRYFRPGHEAEDAHYLTDFVGEVRKFADAAGAKRGRKIKISVRVPQNPEVALSYGMDVQAWAKAGYVDWLISSNSYDSYSLTDDFRRWQEIVGDGVLVIPATDSGLRPYRGAKFRPELNHAAYCGWADLQWTRGAKGLYLFNFQYAHPLLSKNMLGQGLETDALKKREARYVLTYSDLDPATGEGFASPLPRAIGKDPVEFKIECGALANGRKSSVLLGLDGDNTHFWDVRLNGQIPVRMTRSQKKTPMPANREVAATFECEFPAGTVKSGTNVVTVAPSSGGASNRVVWCEIATKPW